MDDVREVLAYYKQFDDPIEAFRENQRKLQEVGGLIQRESISQIERHSNKHVFVAGARHRREEDRGRQDGQERHWVICLRPRAQPGVQEELTQVLAQISLPVSREKIHSELLI